MDKIDKRLTKLMTIDTETCNMVDNDQMPYNMGVVIHDKYERVYYAKNFLIIDVFCGLYSLMESSNYYAEKLPKYFKGASKGEFTFITMFELKKLLTKLCKDYNVKAIIAHNAKFDYQASCNLIRYTTKSKYRYFLPYGVEIWDSQKMAHDTICKQKLYRKWCEKNGYMTQHNPARPQEKAEVLYKYITNNDNFVEEHIGLQDCLIEMAITCKCLSLHKKMRKKLFEKK